MLTMEKNSLELKRSIINAAVHLYTNDRSRFTLNSIALEAECQLEDIQQFFAGKQAILRGFYDQVPDEYRTSTAEIPEYSSLNFGEKASTYIYTTFDVLSAQRDFAEETFDSMVLSRKDTYWHKETARIFQAMVEEDARIPGTNSFVLREPVYRILVNEYMYLVRFWLQDDSRGTERTLALVDKLSTFANELLYSGIIDKGIDLGKYLLGNDIWKFRFSGIGNDTESILNRIRQSGMDMGDDIYAAVNRLSQSFSTRCNREWKPGGCSYQNEHQPSGKDHPDSVEIPVMDDTTGETSSVSGDKP